MPSLSLFVVTAALSGIASRPAGPSAQAPAAAEETAVFVRTAATPRRLVGDWERSDVLVITYTPFWADVLEMLVAQGRQVGQVAVLVPKEASSLTVRTWVSSLAAPAVQRGGVVNTIDVISAGTDTAWVRDYGPLQVRDGNRVVWLDAPYVYRPGDDAVPTLLGQRYQVAVETIPEQLEGGAIVANGAGLCISTTAAFDAAGIDRADAPGMDLLLGQLGCEALALVPALAQDPTHHVDMFLQFVSPSGAILAEPDPVAAPEDAARMDAAADAIGDAAEMLGQRVAITRVPLPVAGDGVYFTYLNGLQLDGTFLVPHYDAVPAHLEELAYERLAEAMPRRSLVPVPADELIRLQGAVHCITLPLALPHDPRTGRARRPTWDTVRFDNPPRGMRAGAPRVGPEP